MNPIAFRWDGKAMAPINRAFAGRAEKQYVVGAIYVLVPHEARSGESHRHYFACLHDAWLNLPEDITDELPTSEHLRAWALVKAGYADKSVINCASKDDAIRMAAIASSGSKIRIVDIVGKTVTVWTPHSQSMKAMGGKRFQDSKTKVLDIVAGLARTTRRVLESNAGQAA
jgi:hypothetical protein